MQKDCFTMETGMGQAAWRAINGCVTRLSDQCPQTDAPKCERAFGQASDGTEVTEPAGITTCSVSTTAAWVCGVREFDAGAFARVTAQECRIRLRHKVPNGKLRRTFHQNRDGTRSRRPATYKAGDAAGLKVKLIKAGGSALLLLKPVNWVWELETRFMAVVAGVIM
jgi:hypothetical protein